MTTIQAATRALKSPIIIGDNVAVREPVNASALDRYKSKGLQVQQLVSKVGIVLLGLLGAAILFIPLFTSNAEAGFLKGPRRAKAHDYYDYQYANHVWDNLRTYSALEEEEKKYDGGYEQWFELLQKKPSDARSVKRDLEGNDHFKKRYDIQLAFDGWWDHFYFIWYSAYKGGRTTDDFEKWLSDANSSRAKTASKCVDRKFLDACGLLPDWRSEAMKQDEQAMMAETDRKLRRK